MTTPTNDRQTSEREMLFADDPPLVKLAAMLQALEFGPAAVNLSAEVLAASCRAVAGQAKDAVALRAENEALRTVTYDDLLRGMEAYEYATGEGWKEEDVPTDWVGVRDPCIQGIRAALESFIRSKEARRG